MLTSFLIYYAGSAAALAGLAWWTIHCTGDGNNTGTCNREQSSYEDNLGLDCEPNEMLAIRSVKHPCTGNCTGIIKKAPVYFIKRGLLKDKPDI